MVQLKAVAKELMQLTRFPDSQLPVSHIESGLVSAKGSNESPSQGEKRWDVAHSLAEHLKSGEAIENKDLVAAPCKQYPEFKGHPNPIMAVDFCANSRSGYRVKPDGSSKRKHCAVLFKKADNHYVRYKPELHGLWECRVINGKKTVIQVHVDK